MEVIAGAVKTDKHGEIIVLNTTYEVTKETALVAFSSRRDLIYRASPLGTLTVCVSAAGLAPGEILLKTWSENEEWAIQAAKGMGYFDTGRRIKTGYTEAQVWRLGAALPTPGEFWEQCQSFDWYYLYSDDHRVYKAGKAGEKALLETAERDPHLMEIYEGWVKHMTSGPAFGTERLPKPPKPEESDDADA